jgi:hypothetical protein
MQSRVFIMVVVKRLFPLGEKNALLIDLPELYVASGVGVDFLDVDLSLRISQSFTVVSNPAVASVVPFG